MAVNRTARLIKVLMALQEHEWTSANELARLLGVSARSIYRDIQSLISLGVPIQSIHGRTGGYTLSRGAGLATFFPSTEALSLFLIGNQSATTTRPPLREKDDYLAKLTRRLHFDTTDWYSRDANEEYISLFRDAAIGKVVLRISFTARRNQASKEMHFACYGLVWKSGHWYAVGVNSKRPRGSIFRVRLSRVLAVERTQETFPYPPNFDIATWWSEELANFGRGNICVHLRGAPSIRNEIARLAQKPDSRVEHYEHFTDIKLMVDDWNWIVPLILSFAGMVQVMAPTDLRRTVQDRFAAGLKVHRSGVSKKPIPLDAESALRAAEYNTETSPLE